MDTDANAAAGLVERSRLVRDHEPTCRRSFPRLFHRLQERLGIGQRLQLSISAAMSALLETGTACSDARACAQWPSTAHGRFLIRIAACAGAHRALGVFLP